MRMVIQRVKQASVTVEGQKVAAIGKGALVLLGVHKHDDFSPIPWLVQKLIHLRMFPREQDNGEVSQDPSLPPPSHQQIPLPIEKSRRGKMELSLLDQKGEVLVVSQFTLYGDCRQGRRPDFTQAAPGSLAELIYLEFVKELRKAIPYVATGVFGAHMEVALLNEGPVTLLVDTDQREKIS